jgi:hypothetical protein
MDGDLLHGKQHEIRPLSVWQTGHGDRLPGFEFLNLLFQQFQLSPGSQADDLKFVR